MFYKLTNDKKKDPMKLHSFTEFYSHTFVIDFIIVISVN